MAITLPSLSRTVCPGNNEDLAADGFGLGFGAWLVGASVGAGDGSSTVGVGIGGDVAGSLGAALLDGVRLGPLSLSESAPPHPTHASPTAATVTKVRFNLMPGTLARSAPQWAEVTDL
ncbi:hypothetical protein ACIQCF_33185 [Streptomyces sp. NPDC088353]|uniref:hypothetical protein n=1 Tax=Streptomyces sp. NPDC088353 TaxID=3365855 RepID=UPI0038027BFC